MARRASRSPPWPAIPTGRWARSRARPWRAWTGSRRELHGRAPAGGGRRLRRRPRAPPRGLPLRARARRRARRARRRLRRGRRHARPRRARVGARARLGARARRGGAAPARLGSARAPASPPRGRRAAGLPAPGAPGAPAPRHGRPGSERRARGLHHRARPSRHGARPRAGERRDRMKQGPSAAALALAWGAVVAVFWGGLVVPSMQPGLRRPMDIDLYGYFVPKFWYGNAGLAAGRLPLWNPYEYGFQKIGRAHV